VNAVLGQYLGLTFGGGRTVTTAPAMVAILAMPRLPTPMATRDPGFTREPNDEAASCLCTSLATSRIARSGNF
jgi:hypothetical protein